MHLLQTLTILRGEMKGWVDASPQEETCIIWQDLMKEDLKVGRMLGLT